MRRKARPWVGVVGAYVFLIVLLVVRGLLAPGSMTAGNLLDLLRQAAPLGLVAIGQTIALLIGGIDLSVAAVITLTNVLAATMMASGNQAIVPTVLVVVAIAAAIGAVNGLIVTKLRVPAIITTLAMAILLQGAYLLYTRGSPTGKIAPGFRVIAEGWILGLPWAAIVWAIILVATGFLLHRTTFGRKLYATGGNPQAAWLSGISRDGITILAFSLCSVMAAFAGLMLSAYIGVASTSVGAGYDLSSITAVVIGGTAFTGGFGGLTGTVGGVLVLTVLQSLLTMMNIGDPGRLVLQGAVIIGMMALYQWQFRRD